MADKNNFEKMPDGREEVPGIGGRVRRSTNVGGEFAKAPGNVIPSALSKEDSGLVRGAVRVVCLDGKNTLAATAHAPLAEKDSNPVSALSGRVRRGTVALELEERSTASSSAPALAATDMVKKASRAYRRANMVLPSDAVAAPGSEIAEALPENVPLTPPPVDLPVAPGSIHGTAEYFPASLADGRPSLPTLEMPIVRLKEIPEAVRALLALILLGALMAGAWQLVKHSTPPDFQMPQNSR